MPSITTAEVARLARLARIDLTELELDVLAPQLGQILDAVARVQQAGVDDVPGTSHPVALTNVFRPDVIVAPLGAAAVLAGAPAAEDGRFRVPQILGEEQ